MEMPKTADGSDDLISFNKSLQKSWDNLFATDREQEMVSSRNSEIGADRGRMIRG